MPGPAAHDANPPQSYEICIRGELSDALVQELGANRRSPRTTVVVSASDRADLHTLLRRLEDLGLELLSIHEVADGSPDATATGQSPDPGDVRLLVDPEDRTRPTETPKEPDRWN